MKAIVNGKIILKDKILEEYVIVFKKKITEIISQSEFDKKKLNIDIIDAKGKYISPGLIDIHIHGCANSDVMDGSLEALENIGKTILENGVTSYLPTTMTMSKKSIIKALENIKNTLRKNIRSAEILGVHLEGPFINSKYKGAQNEKFIIEPNYEFIKPYLNIIKIITYAPEKDIDYKFTEKICTCHKNITLSIGHTDADYKTCMEVISKGVSHVTHLFNAMPGFHHREPGVVGAAFNTEVSCELIADNIHINPENYNIVLNIKSKDKLVLITDSMRAGCLKNGKYDLGGQEVIVNGNAARLSDGTLAGSVLKLNNAVCNIHKKTDLKLIDSIRLASLNPAKVIGVDDRKGSLEIGKDADIILIDDNLKVFKTILKGEVVFVKNE